MYFDQNGNVYMQICIYRQYFNYIYRFGIKYINKFTHLFIWTDKQKHKMRNRCTISEWIYFIELNASIDAGKTATKLQKHYFRIWKCYRCLSLISHRYIKWNATMNTQSYICWTMSIGFRRHVLNEYERFCENGR